VCDVAVIVDWLVCCEQTLGTMSDMSVVCFCFIQGHMAGFSATHVIVVLGKYLYLIFYITLIYLLLTISSVGEATVRRASAG
jgi:uncharacterized membrane protein